MSIVDAILRAEGGLGTLTVLDARSGTPETIRTALHRQALRTASVLVAAGVGRGRIGLLGDTSVGLVTSLQAVWLSGAAVTVLPVPGRRAGWDRLSLIITDAALDLVIADAALAADAAGLLAVPVIPLPELQGKARSATSAAVRPPDPVDLAVLQYTSGSTRSPRGVPVTHRHLDAQLGALREVVQHDRWHPQPMLSWEPSTGSTARAHGTR